MTMSVQSFIHDSLCTTTTTHEKETFIQDFLGNQKYLLKHFENIFLLLRNDI